MIQSILCTASGSIVIIVLFVIVKKHFGDTCASVLLYGIAIASVACLLYSSNNGSSSIIQTEIEETLQHIETMYDNETTVVSVSQ